MERTLARAKRPAAAPGTARRRCPWCESTPLYRAYHDREWGVPVHSDRRWFEMLVLDGAQAGLSWRTILEKRAGYRRAFDRFDPRKVARYDARKVASLLRDPGIVRNRLKVASAVTNARAFLEVQREFGSFDRFIWGFTAGRPLQNRRRSVRQVPARTPLADAVSAELRRRGFAAVVVVNRVYGLSFCLAGAAATAALARSRPLCAAAQVGSMSSALLKKTSAFAASPPAR